jgi:acyl-CoA hydrolase
MNEIVLPSHANAVGSMFGGVLMSWIDVCAGISAGRHARAVVVTASMDQLDFEAPIRVGDVVTLRAMVNAAGRSSMEVGVRVEREVPTTGERVHAASAYLTFVALDAAGNPTRVPSISPESDLERLRFDEAQLRRAKRLETANARKAMRSGRSL